WRRRRIEVRVVEDVVALCAEDQFDLLTQGLCLLEDDVAIDKAGAIKLVAMNGAALAIGLVSEGRVGGADDPARRDGGSTTGGVGLSDKLGTVGGIGVEAVAGAAQIEGQAGLGLLDTGD